MHEKLENNYPMTIQALVINCEEKPLSKDEYMDYNTDEPHQFISDSVRIFY